MSVANSKQKMTSHKQQLTGGCCNSARSKAGPCHSITGWMQQPQLVSLVSIVEEPWHYNQQWQDKLWQQIILWLLVLVVVLAVLGSYNGCLQLVLLWPLIVVIVVLGCDCHCGCCHHWLWLFWLQIVDFVVNGYSCHGHWLLWSWMGLLHSLIVAALVVDCWLHGGWLLLLLQSIYCCSHGCGC